VLHAESPAKLDAQGSAAAQFLGLMELYATVGCSVYSAPSFVSQ
jgi:hypothetical protein